MIVRSVGDAVVRDMFYELRDFAPGLDVLVKLEGLNPAGSIKVKSAAAMIRRLAEQGVLHPGSHIVESTSGNLGVALAAVAAAEGYRLTLVTDPNASSHNVRAMRALGAEVVVVTGRDANDGFLGSRIDHILGMLAADPDLLWLNQYANRAPVVAHRDGTAEEILAEVGPPDWLFVGAGTTGTLMGVLERFAQFRGRTTVVGVDAIGSVTFGGPPGRRRVPGLGTSRMPEIFDPAAEFTRVQVSESDTIRTCRWVAREHGLLLGGSSGTVLAAVHLLRDRIAPGARVVAISPDMGDHYLDTIYDDEWVTCYFGSEVADIDPPFPGKGVLNLV